MGGVILFQFTTKTRYSEVDQKGTLSIIALINYLQDTAAFHSDSVGHGLSQLRDTGNGWYILNWELEIISLPKYGEEFTVTTWPYDMHGMFSRRNFTIENNTGETLVIGNSLWVFMDLTTIQPTRIPSEAMALYKLSPPLEHDWGPRKIKLPPAEEFVFHGEVTVMPVHLDTNRHMNNAYYVEIARDTLPKDKKIFGIRVEYKNPAKLDDRILVCLALKDEHAYVTLKSPEEKTFSVVEFQIH